MKMNWQQKNWKIYFIPNDERYNMKQPNGTMTNLEGIGWMEEWVM